MLIIMQSDAGAKQTAAVLALAEAGKLRPYLSNAHGRRVIALVSEDEELVQTVRALPGVEDVQPLRGGAKLSTRAFRSADSIVRIASSQNHRNVNSAIAAERPANEVLVGGGHFAVMAGPCSVENRESLLTCAHAVKSAGAVMLRGGAFKPRTSPYGFQGLGRRGLEILAEARAATGMPVVTEVMSVEDLELVVEFADLLQIGARNMQNFALLRAVGETGRPILLKRGMMSTIDELLMAAEYILAAGNENVILCERGIRTFEQSTRNTMDIAAVPVLRKRSHLPIMVDPSHAAGHRDLVTALAYAAVAAGADGLLVEVHPEPDKALTDADQTISTQQFEVLMRGVAAIRDALKRI